MQFEAIYTENRLYTKADDALMRHFIVSDEIIKKNVISDKIYSMN